MKKVQDEQAGLRDKIATLQASNQQDAEAIESAKVEFEEAKKIALQEEKNAEDIRLRTDASLDKALAEFKKQIEEELAGIEGENQVRLKQITNLNLQRRNLKPKYSTLPGMFEDRNRASSTFQQACCSGDRQDSRCGGSELGGDPFGSGLN